MEITDTDALIVVDVQNDFCPGGALPVPGGDGVVTAINRLLVIFDHVFYTRDWHPEDHCSFSERPEFRDGSWPAHCVQNSPGAEFHGDLIVPLDAQIISKGTEPDAEAYSGFIGTELGALLRARGITRVVVTGLATDYCVKHTAMDAVREGFETWVVQDACRGVDDGGTVEALEQMKAAGIRLCRAGELSG